MKSTAARWIISMSPTIKYLSLGLAIGVFIAALLISGIFATPAVIAIAGTAAASTSTAAPFATEAPTATFTVSPTAAPTITPTPTFTATPTAIEQMIRSGQLLLTGHLSAQQQIILYQTSLHFIAPTTKESIVVGERINGKGYGHPSLICGPLSIAILREAGLLSADAAPYDFWLLNPDLGEDRLLIEKTFPSDRYDNTRFTIPLNQFDWRTYPLQPGDFLYIYHGPGGNFDHMLVVSRVDSRGRAYAVTNYDTPSGFIINEVMLYDPNDPNAGLFHTWTEIQYAALGSTGFGGFEVWRLRASQ